MTTKTKSKHLQLYTPHVAQQELHSSPARFRTACCGRRWGKTLACLNETLKTAWENPSAICWWVAPTYAQSMIAYRMLSKCVEVIEENLKSERRIVLINGAEIVFKSADNPDSLRGEGLNILVIDEAGMIAREAWEEALRPALSDKKGRALFISSPRGRNWFYELFLRGKDKDSPEYESFSFPTASNPFIDPADIEEARRSLPERVFRQEYLAEFIDDAGAVFQNIKQCVGPVPQNPREPYSIGVDLAKYVDFTVVTVMDAQKHVIDIQRWNESSYPLQKEKIRHVCLKYKDARIIVDQTGIGDPIVDDLRNSGLSIEGLKFTNESKQSLIETLILTFEKQTITIPDYKPLIHELEAFSYEMTKTGLIRYNAPSGYHDDCVISLALALKGQTNNMSNFTIWTKDSIASQADW